MQAGIQEVSSNDDVHRSFRCDAVNVCQFHCRFTDWNALRRLRHHEQATGEDFIKWTGQRDNKY
jgi:hypothetical protein